MEISCVLALELLATIHDEHVLVKRSREDCSLDERIPNVGDSAWVYNDKK